MLRDVSALLDLFRLVIGRMLVALAWASQILLERVLVVVLFSVEVAAVEF